MAPWRSWALVVALCLGTLAPAEAQRLTGIVHRGQDGRSLAGVWVRVLDQDLQPIDSVRTDGVGRFAVDLPSAGRYVVVAEASDHGAAPETVEVADGETASLLLVLTALPGVVVDVREERGGDRVDVVGRVLDRRTRRPVQGVDIRLDGRGAATVTNAGGRFVLREQEAGVVVVRTSHLGYAERADTVQLSPGWAYELTLWLDEEAIVLEGIDVQARSRPAVRLLQPVFERMDRGLGGHFIVAEQLETYGYPSLYEALDRLPSVKVRRARGTLVFVEIREGCRPALFIDGVLAIRPEQPVDVLWNIRTMDIEVIEMYPGPATLPAEFHYSGVRCAIGVWTKRGG